MLWTLLWTFWTFHTFWTFWTYILQDGQLLGLWTNNQLLAPNALSACRDLTLCKDLDGKLDNTELSGSLHPQVHKSYYNEIQPLSLNNLYMKQCLREKFYIQGSEDYFVSLWLLGMRKCNRDVYCNYTMVGDHVKWSMKKYN